MGKYSLKTCSILLVIVLLVNMLPMTIFAEDFQDLIASSNATVGDNDAITSETCIVDEIVENRTEYSKEFLLSNGLHMATVYAEPVHYETADGWEEIDNTLKTNPDGTYSNTEGIWEVTFPQQLSDSDNVTLEKDGYTLSFQLDGELNTSNVATYGLGNKRFQVKQVKETEASIQEMDWSKMQQSVEHEEVIPEKSKSRLTYADIYENTDIVYDLDANTFKESIILEQYSDTLQGYTYTLEVGSMIPVLEDDGQITLYDKDQENIVMIMPAPFLVDNAQVYNYDIQVQLTGSGSTYTLNYLLPTDWLAENDRAWPVVLDPWVLAELEASNIRDRTVAENKTYSQTQGTNICGWANDTGRLHSYIKYAELPAITSSDVVLYAKMYMLQGYSSSTTTTVEVHKVLGTWDSSTITWSNKPDYNETVEDCVIAYEPVEYSWNVTDIVRDWYSNANTGMMFKASNATETGGTNSFKTFISSDYTNNDAYKPTLAIYFRNNNGLESYWDYTSSSAGRAGTGHINNFTGNLVWTRDDIGFGGNRMPVTISHVYNLNDANIPSDNNNSNDSGGNSFGMGIGWRTNFNQLIYKWNVDSNYYIWEDSDGTDHYFAYDSEIEKYKDEDGLELTLTDTGSGTQKYCITNKNGNCSYFDTQGRLTKLSNNQATKSHITISYVGNTKRISSVTDGVGRKYNFLYDNNFLSEIQYTGTGTDVLHSVQFFYTYSRLIRVHDADGKDSTFTYTNNNLLLSAQDIDGYKLTYTYTTPQASWQPYRVSSVSAAHGTAAGNSLSFAYAHNQTTITERDNDGNSQNDNTEIHQFNDFGNTICIQDNEGRAQYTQFALNTQNYKKDNETKTDANTTQKANQMTLSSELQYTVSNLLLHNNMHTSAEWEKYGYVYNMTISGDRCRADTKSLYVQLRPTESNNATDAVREQAANAVGTPRGIRSMEYTIEPGQTQTFSCFVTANSSTDSSIYVMAKSSSTEVRSDTLAPSTSMRRLQVSYTNKTQATETVRYYVLTEDGKNGFYMDCAQLELAPTASRYNIIRNGDFNNGTDAWKAVKCKSSDGISTMENPNAPQLDSNAFKIEGDPYTAKSVSQTVWVPGKAGTSLTISGWAKGNALPFNDDKDYPREFAIRCTITYEDGTKSEPFIARFNPDVDNWQYTATGIVAEKKFWAIKIELVYEYNANTVYFDGIQLNLDEFGTSYTYDKDGNVVSVVNASSQRTQYKYTNNNLTKEILHTGSELTYEYDNYHNVITATTKEGLVYTFEYDTYGNNTKVSITDGTSTMSSTAEYSTDGNCLLSTTDAIGNITYYDYDLQTNVLNWVKYPGDTDATKTAYDYDNMYRLASAACTTDTGLSLSANYTYNNDLLTAIQTPTTTYGFTYGVFGLRTGVSIGDQSLANYTYTNDGNYNLSRLDYGNGDRVQYTYDDKGRVLTQTYEDGTTFSYTYDNSGQLATITDSSTGVTAFYGHEHNGNVVRYEESGEGYSYILLYTYDAQDQLVYVQEEVNGHDRGGPLTYDDDNRLKSFQRAYAKRTYTYDDFDRISGVTTVNLHKNADAELQTSYTFTSFETDDGTATTSQVSSVQNKTEEYESTYHYTYDDNGNILTVSDGTNTTSYVYDSANQLIRENNQAGNFIHVWTYDNAGNITSRTEYVYTPGELGTPTNTISYTYGDTNWGDLLTAYNGNAITYDQIGNPESDGTWNYTWQHGRQLASMSTPDGATTWTYSYNANGMRTKRTDGTKTYQYVYDGSVLTYMNVDGKILRFAHSPDGAPMSVLYESATYLYVTNLQGDVVAILDQSGNVVVEYTYDAWGNIISIDGSMKDTLGKANPLRYRGYVYDQEAGLYYVSSRYYDPEIGRFINADAVDLLGANGDFASLNLFAYCGNNPVSRADCSGYLWTNVLIGAVVGAVAGVVGQVISDVVTSVLNGEVTISNWQTYTGAAVGGAAGGVVLATTGNMNAANAVTGTVTTGVGQSLEKLTISNYNKSWAEIGTNAVVDGAVSYSLGKLPGIRGATAGRNSWSAVYKSGLTKLKNGTAARMSVKVVAKGFGSSVVGGFALDGYYGAKQHAYDRVKSLLD